MVRLHQPITGDQIAERLGLSRTTLRSDMSILTMLHVLNAKPKVGYFLGSSLPAAHTRTDELRGIIVKDVISAPITISDQATAQEAVVTLFRENTGTLMVTGSDGKLKGIVSRNDLLKLSMGNADMAVIPVALVMTRRAQTATLFQDENILGAMRKLVRHQVNCLPVIRRKEELEQEEGPELIGKVTKTDILRKILEVAGEGTSDLK